MITFEPGKTTLALDILPTFHRRMVIGEDGWLSLTMAHALGFEIIRVSLTDQDIMPYERYTADFWLWFKNRITGLHNIGFTIILSVGGYYRVNVNNLNQAQRKEITEKAIDIMNDVCGKHNFIVEIANEPAIAPQWYRRLDNEGDKYSVLGRYLGEVARWCVLKGVQPRHIMVPGGWGGEYTRSQWYSHCCGIGVAEKTGAPLENIIRTWHNFFGRLDAPSYLEIPTPLIAHWSNDGNSFSGIPGQGYTPPGGKYGGPSAAQVNASLDTAVYRAKQDGNHVIVADLLREVFVRYDGAYWHFDMSRIDLERLEKIANHWKELNKEDEIEPEPEPEPEPTPEPVPEPVGFWTKLWNIIKNFFNNLFGWK